MLKIVHISDTHNKHEELEIPECDVLLFTGDIGGRTDLKQLMRFLVWFEKQPADKKIFIGGNHDIILDKKWMEQKQFTGGIEALLSRQSYYDAIKLIESYSVIYLNNKEYIYKGVKFYGSPYSPSFHRQNWVFNADRGKEIMKEWAKIPSDVNILLTHTPVYGVMDDLKDCWDGIEERFVGCKDLLSVIEKRLHSLKLHCSGHIHSNYGVMQYDVSNSRKCLISNGAVVDNQYNILINKPLIINI